MTIRLRASWGVAALLLAACGSNDDPDPADVGGPDWEFDFGDDTGQPDTASDAGESDAAVEVGGPTSCGTTPLPFEFDREDDVPTEDCWAPSVCMAREATGPIFNAALEDEPHRFGCESVSPLGTEWAIGRCVGNEGPFTSLRVAHECEPMMDIGGKRFCAHVVEEDLWFDIEFLSFNGGTDGGGFSYRRTLAGGDPCGVGALCERTETGIACSCPDGTGGDPASFCL